MYFCCCGVYDFFLTDAMKPENLTGQVRGHKLISLWREVKTGRRLWKTVNFSWVKDALKEVGMSPTARKIIMK